MKYSSENLPCLQLNDLGMNLCTAYVNKDLDSWPSVRHLKLDKSLVTSVDTSLSKRQAVDILEVAFPGAKIEIDRYEVCVCTD